MYEKFGCPFNGHLRNMTNKELMALPLDERRKIMEEQSADLVDYYKTTDLWENLEGEEDEYERGTKNGKRDD